MPRTPKDPTAGIKEKSTKPKTEIPVITLAGDTVQRFNEARDQIDRAKKVIEALAPDLTEAGVKAVFRHNIANADAPKSQISSVRIQDKRDKPPGPDEAVETVLFSWTKKNKTCDSARVESFFQRLAESDPEIKRETYAVWAVEAKFDAKVFIEPTTGKFSQARYDEFESALDAVCKKFKVANPLSATKSMQPTADFHIRRFKDFDLQMNVNLTEVLPTTTQLEPERPELEEEEV